ncbi:SCO2583/SCO2584 N-terminal domain-containing protein [Kitasatospora mediocidica]|uniref:SCO2583/SCO2584 N-terminal domain-containing protein n=1 Tax=Kitasatospora mediocidica TaxID=58352 RepID=UPI00068E63FD|nr:hypothetical protein [Kitasatospora mediocidica]
MPIAEDPDFPPPSSEQEQEPDPFAGLVLDDDFVKAAAVKEQSGRARHLAAKWKNNPPEEPQPWRPPTEIRRGRFDRKAKRVDAWGNPVRRSKRNWQTPVFVLLAASVVLAGLNVDRLHTWYDTHIGAGPGNGGTAGAPMSPKPITTQAPETAAPSAAPSTEAPDNPTVDHPWAGSPALAWPAGADGIALPPGQATGTFGADEVTAKLQLVKAFLVASNLDPAVVAGGSPQAALGMLDRQERDTATAALAHPSTDHDPTIWFSRFNPRTAVPAGDVVKVQGHTSFESDGDHGLLVHTDYTFVYALVPGPDVYWPSAAPSPSPQGGGSGGAGGGTQSVGWLQLKGSTEVTRDIVRREQDFRFADPARYDVDPTKLELGKGYSDMGNNYCQTGDGWLEPTFPQTDAGGGREAQTGPTSDPYDHSKPLPENDKCGTISRS